jgi:hypothetical protein
VLVTSRAPGYPEERVGPVRFGGTELDRTLAGEICLVGSGVSMVPVLLQCASDHWTIPKQISSICQSRQSVITKPRRYLELRTDGNDFAPLEPPFVLQV